MGGKAGRGGSEHCPAASAARPCPTAAAARPCPAAARTHDQGREVVLEAVGPGPQSPAAPLCKHAELLSSQGGIDSQI